MLDVSLCTIEHTVAYPATHLPFTVFVQIAKLVLASGPGRFISRRGLYSGEIIGSVLTFSALPCPVISQRRLKTAVDWQAHICLPIRLLRAGSAWSLKHD